MPKKIPELSKCFPPYTDFHYNPDSAGSDDDSDSDDSETKSSGK